jgi:hypothetical protein
MTSENIQNNKPSATAVAEGHVGHGQGKTSGTGAPGAYGETSRARLIENYNYDLVQELTQLLKGVWRIDQYLKDSGGRCDDCGKIWTDVRKQNELLVEKLRQEIVNHAKNGRFV